MVGSRDKSAGEPHEQRGSASDYSILQHYLYSTNHYLSSTTSLLGLTPGPGIGRYLQMAAPGAWVAGIC